MTLGQNANALLSFLDLELAVITARVQRSVLKHQRWILKITTGLRSLPEGRKLFLSTKWPERDRLLLFITQCHAVRN